MPEGQKHALHVLLYDEPKRLVRRRTVRQGEHDDREIGMGQLDAAALEGLRALRGGRMRAQQLADEPLAQEGQIVAHRALRVRELVR